MEKLNEEQITKIERFMEDESFDNVDFMLASFRRLRKFARDVYEESCLLENKGDLEP